MGNLMQVKLVRPVPGAGQIQMTTWVDADPRLKKGVVIELKKDNRKWMVEEVYSTVDEKLIKDGRDFDNNNYDKHTGLFGRQS